MNAKKDPDLQKSTHQNMNKAAQFNLIKNLVSQLNSKKTLRIIKNEIYGVNNTYTYIYKSHAYNYKR